MRILWCYLLLLFVLAPAGTVGITVAPGDVETTLTAPRAQSSVSARKLADEPAPAIVPAVAPVVGNGPGVPSGRQAPLIAAAPSGYESVAGARPRAPPV